MNTIVLYPVNNGPAIIKTGKQGPPGIGGSEVTPEFIGALSVTARLAEFDTDEKRAAARDNIGLTVIDGGEFF